MVKKTAVIFMVALTYFESNCIILLECGTPK